MKSLLPLCLIVVATPALLTGCNRNSDMSSTTATDTNAAPVTNTAPAMTDTNIAPATTPTVADTNATPTPSASADTNMTPATTNAPATPSTNSGM